MRSTQLTQPGPTRVGQHEHLAGLAQHGHGAGEQVAPGGGQPAAGQVEAVAARPSLRRARRLLALGAAVLGRPGAGPVAGHSAIATSRARARRPRAQTIDNSS